MSIGPLRPPGASSPAPASGPLPGPLPGAVPEPPPAPTASPLPEHLVAPATPLAPVPMGPSIAPAVPPPAGVRSTAANVLFLLAGALAVLMALAAGLAADAADGAEQLGEIIGALLFVFGAPALARVVDVRVVRRGAGLPFWTPWILVIACAIALMARFGQMGEAAQRPAVPDVVGLPVTTAWQQLEQAGVRMGGVAPTDPSLYVCAQTPGPTVQLRVGGPECASGTAS